MVARTFWLRGVRVPVENWLALQDGGPAPQSEITGTGWNVGTVASGNYSQMAARAERASGTFSATVVPHSTLTPDTTIGDAFRSRAKLSGTFASGDWALTFLVRATTLGDGQDGRMRARLLKGTAADGSNATQFAAATAGTTVTNLTDSTPQPSVVTFSAVAQTTFVGEYLFIQVAWEITGAGAGADCDVLLYQGSASTDSARLVTPDFISTAVKPEVMVEVDWANGAAWGASANARGRYEDITDHVMGFRSQRGKSEATQILIRSTPGTCTIDARNDDGFFSPFNVASPIWGFTLGNYRLRIRTSVPVDDGVWGGRIETIVQEAAQGAAPMAAIEASGPLRWLADRRLDFPAYVGPDDTSNLLKPVGYWVNQLLDKVSFPDTKDDVLVTKGTTVSPAISGTTALDGLALLEDIELGAVLESATGGVIFEGRDDRLTKTSAGTFSDGSAATLSYSVVGASDPRRWVYDKVQLKATGYEFGFAVAAIYVQLAPNAPMRLADIDPGGGTADLTFEYDGRYGVPVTWYAPVAADGELRWDNNIPASDIGLAIIDSGLNGVTVRVTNNHATLRLKPTGISVRITPLVKQAELVITVGTGLRLFPRQALGSPPASPVLDPSGAPAGSFAYSSVEDAQDAAQRILEHFQYPRNVLSISLEAQRNSTQLQHAIERDLSDRLTVTASGTKTQLGFSEDFYIESISHSYQVTPGLWTTTWLLSAVNPSRPGVVAALGDSPDDYAIFESATFDQKVFA